ncbi:hypothetical protein GCM10027442_15810 [Emticicia fontis]
MMCCSKDSAEPADDLNTGSVSLTVEGVTYNFEVDYKATGQQNANAVFATNSTGNTTTLTASNTKDGTALAIRVDSKAIQTIGDYPINPGNETGVVTFSTKTTNYKQSYQDGCDNKLLYTNVTLGVSKMSKNNLTVQGTINGRLVRADGELDCTNLKVIKWKQVDVVGTFRLHWEIIP